MSEYEVIDDAGRKWEYIGRSKTAKVWSTTIDGHDVIIQSSVDQGWLLVQNNKVNIPLNERLIEPAIRAAQVHLRPSGPPVRKVPPTTDEQVREAASGGKSIGTARFDAWLARHDQELIDAITSVANVMEKS